MLRELLSVALVAAVVNIRDSEASRTHRRWLLPTRGVAAQALSAAYTRGAPLWDMAAYGGPGLRLPTAKHMLEDYGAHISVSSCSRSGSTFTVAIPMSRRWPQAHLLGVFDLGANPTLRHPPPKRLQALRWHEVFVHGRFALYDGVALPRMGCALSAIRACSTFVHKESSLSA
jgi:hypothetical protein